MGIFKNNALKVFWIVAGSIFLVLDTDIKAAWTSQDLFEAVVGGETDLVKTILDRDPLLIHSVHLSNKPLSWALISNQGKELVKLLLERGAHAHGAFPDTFDSRGNTPIKYAITFQNFDSVALLLEHGARADSPCSQTIYMRDGSHVPGSLIEEYPLHLVIDQWSNHEAYVQCIKALLDRGASALDVDHLGRTAMHLAAGRNREDVMDILLESKMGSRSSRLALLSAMKYEQLRRAQHISENHGDALFCCQRCAETALQDFRQCPIPLWLRNVLLVNKMYGEMIDGRDGCGWTPLHHAVSSFGDGRSKESISFLLALGADTTLKDMDGETPKDVAIRTQRDENIRPFLEREAEMKKRELGADERQGMICD